MGNDLEIGRFAMIGMGSVVTKSVPDFHLALGHPAVSVGCVCRCGQLLMRFVEPSAVSETGVTCSACALPYAIDHGRVIECAPPA